MIVRNVLQSCVCAFGSTNQPVLQHKLVLLHRLHWLSSQANNEKSLLYCHPIHRRCYLCTSANHRTLPALRFFSSAVLIGRLGGRPQSWRRLTEPALATDRFSPHISQLVTAHSWQEQATARRTLLTFINKYCPPISSSSKSDRLHRPVSSATNLQSLGYSISLNVMSSDDSDRSNDGVLLPPAPHSSTLVAPTSQLAVQADLSVIEQGTDSTGVFESSNSEWQTAGNSNSGLSTKRRSTMASGNNSNTASATPSIVTKYGNSGIVHLIDVFFKEIHANSMIGGAVLSPHGALFHSFITHSFDHLLHVAVCWTLELQQRLIQLFEKVQPWLNTSSNDKLVCILLIYSSFDSGHVS